MSDAELIQAVLALVRELATREPLWAEWVLTMLRVHFGN